MTLFDLRLGNGLTLESTLETPEVVVGTLAEPVGRGLASSSVSSLESIVLAGLDPLVNGGKGGLDVISKEVSVEGGRGSKVVISNAPPVSIEVMGALHLPDARVNLVSDLTRLEWGGFSDCGQKGSSEGKEGTEGLHFRYFWWG